MVYREGDEPVAVKAGGDTNHPENWGEKGADLNSLPKPSEDDPSSADREREETTEVKMDAPVDVHTAFLVVISSDGRAFNVTNISGVEMHHLATPHEVFRACTDVADQISQVRAMAETFRRTEPLLRTSMHGSRDILKQAMLEVLIDTGIVRVKEPEDGGK